MILRDEYLRFQGTIDKKALKALPELAKLADIERIYQNAGVRRITGWQDLWGTPRTNEYAIETGSVFLFQSSTPFDDVFLKALFTLEENGIGERRTEGFGQICISDLFHQEVNPR